MDVLRCKTPELVHKELLFHQIAYNLVRTLMLEAAQRRQEEPLLDPLRLSLAGACAAIRQVGARALRNALPDLQNGLAERAFPMYRARRNSSASRPH